MICSPTKEQCEADTVTLLRHLADHGHKASLSKLQFVQQEVVFLGHVITAEGKSLSPKRVEAIQKLPKPLTKKQLMSFLGMCSYCRQFIPNYAELEAPLGALIYGKGLQSSDRLTWTHDATQAFTDLKLLLQSTPTLGLPDPLRPFTQTVDEKNGCMTSVLLQEHGGRLRPVAYFSSKLDPVAAGLPRCLRAVAAAEKAVLASREIVGYSDLTLLVPHAVSMILLEQKTSHLSTARWLRYNTVLLDMPNITVKRCTVLNPATLLPSPDDGEAHDCVAILQQVCTPRPDLRETPLTNPDLVFYVDGSAFRDTQSGLNKVGFAVCDDHSIVQSGSLPSNYSAQAAELIALTAACTLAKGRSVTIYTDSRYAFGVVHDFGALWKHRNFLKSDGKPILHHDKVLALLDAILLPKQIAVCKCQAHTGDTDSVSKGNARADAAAKRAADLSLPPPPAEAFCFLSHTLPDSLSALQSFASPPEVTQWRACGAQYKDKVWFGPDGLPCFPKHFFPHFAKLTHGLDHVSKGGMLQAITQHWFTKGFAAYAQKYCQSCVICATYNAGRGIPVPAAAHPTPDKPFDHLMMDFIELTPDKGKKYCLVMVDMWSKWVEAFPAKHANSHAVTKALLTEIIPRWGIPSRISSDNGTHFVNAAVEAVGQFLGIDMKKHCVYHPQSGGAVERENGTLKAKLAKCCEETVSQQVKAALPQQATGPLHSIQPGDWVVIKNLRRKHWRSERWQGPFQVLLTTHTAVKVAERATWIHAHHCKRVPNPTES
ncbi:protein NYNRIN-like [Larimichthys crocea]|uniref:protein NYNRIN-like n=1 Tax=Larimichthys crocea TaxID=215358 RepID=UPI000F5DFB1F|nr:protein NYNRIN-like [Larimichthys crocea]